MFYINKYSHILTAYLLPSECLNLASGSLKGEGARFFVKLVFEKAVDQQTKNP